MKSPKKIKALRQTSLPSSMLPRVNSEIWFNKMQYLIYHKNLVSLKNKISKENQTYSYLLDLNNKTSVLNQEI